MPNWCTNTLTVEGDPDVVQKFREDNTHVEVGPDAGLADGDQNVLPLSFEAQYPTPRMPDGSLLGEPQNPSPGVRWTGDDNWYDWRVREWGTKWDLSTETDVYPIEGGIEYQFDTAWAPPVEWLTKIAAKYPELIFYMDFQEEGMGFAGGVEFSGGVLVSESEYQLEYDEETGEISRV